ncbi:hypothetical protein EAF04_005366 [Stromatinia cepivora]|nr:hypothetical protein EAF04_005366 [Stromatinia cepivora]
MAAASDNKRFDSFHHSFDSARTELGVAVSQDAVQVVFSTAATIVAQNLVLELIIALQNQPNLRTLPSQNGRANLLGDLMTLGSRVISKDFDIKSAIPLVELVVNNAPDIEIYNAVSELVEQTHVEVDQRILEELTGRIYYDVGGFYERYFEGKSWADNARDIYEVSRARYTENRWTGWPEPSFQIKFFEWLMKFQDAIFSGLSRKYYTSANKVLRGSDANRKLDIFLASADAALPDSEHDWSNVFVIGEHKKNPDQDRSTETLVQLAGYAYEVFGSQPERRFVPGFTICGSIMRLWVFDRSGLYNSENFDIHKEPERFVKVLTGYAMMSDAELGLNTFIKRDNNSKYIIAQNIKISLEDKPIASTKAIVCRGTTCYRGRRPGSTNWEYVVKFAWPSDKRQREGELLRMAKEKGVTGIAVWFNHEQITIDGEPDTISHLRRAMKFGSPRRPLKKALWVDSSTEPSHASLKTSLSKRPESNAAHLVGLGISRPNIATSCGQKRKGDERFDGSTRLKKSKLSGSHANATNVRKGSAIGAPSIQETVIDSLAEGRNKWQQNNVDSSHEAEADTGCESEMYDNRVNYCLVTSPAGRPLHGYRSVRELLEALRDAIRGHRSLFEDGKILHRDISENNIIITEPLAEDDPRGRLIDLDLAKELEGTATGARHRTGTMQFMAIEVLEGNDHTYRHDLESFFYVFVWMCIRYGYEGMGRQNPKKVMKQKKNILQNWYTGTYIQIASTKQSLMGKKRFENVIAEFAPKFENLKELARELRSVLFPIIDEDIFTGTFHKHDVMYGGMIMALDKAIGRLRKEEQAIA